MQSGFMAKLAAAVVSAVAWRIWRRKQLVIYSAGVSEICQRRNVAAEKQWLAGALAGSMKAVGWRLMANRS